MPTMSPQAWARYRKCDAPDCENESLPQNRLVLSPAIGPALDVPLCLYFCPEHRDVGALFERYQSLPPAAQRGAVSG
jgi:hypothetical protein